MIWWIMSGDLVLIDKRLTIDLSTDTWDIRYTHNTLAYKNKNMIGFTNDRIGYTHDRTAYTNDTIRLTHDRIG